MEEVVQEVVQEDKVSGVEAEEEGELVVLEEVEMLM